MTSCEHCHFVYESLSAATAPEALRHGAREIRERLGLALVTAGGVEQLRTRPEPTTWSALEYAAHVRDVLLVQHSRIYETLVEEVPSFPPMHREERVTLGGYNDEDPASTATEVTIAADLVARVLFRLDAAQWRKKCWYNFPTRHEVDLLWIAQHCAHEIVHHLADIDEVMARSSAQEIDVT